VESPSWRDERLARCEFTLRDSAPPAAVTCGRQEHGRQVHRIDAPAAPPLGDGLWTQTPGLAIAIRVADCVPVLLWDPEAAAVAAVHAGWRGTALDIVGAAVGEGVSLGVEPRRLKAAIGPSIGPCCFEVGDEVVAGLVDCGLSEQEFGLRAGPRGRPHVNLRSANRRQLRRAGLQDCNIEDVGGCSYCDADRYESFRRDGDRSGRMHGIIALAPMLLALGLSALFAMGCSAPEPEVDTDLLLAERIDAAQQMLGDGRTGLAETELRALLAERPDDAHLRALLARALHLQGRYTEALVQGRLGLGIDPQLWQSAYNLACSSAANGDIDQGIRWLQVALRSGVPTKQDVVNDPDLQPLKDDHRFAYYVKTNILLRDDKDVLAEIDRPMVTVGESANLKLSVVALNRPLMAPREEVEVRPKNPFPSGFIHPISRKESFSTGEQGGREFAQRTFLYTFEVLREGLLQFGPFEVRQGDSVHFTQPVLLRVNHDSGTMRPSTVGQTLIEPGEFFASPSIADKQLRLLHERRGGAVVALDPLAKESIESPWNFDGEAGSRFFQFRAARIDRLPLSLPPRQPQVFRSTLVQRGTEGLSHVAELRRGSGVSYPKESSYK